jgi:periplasmic divalent cation tolerance protein
VQVFCIEKSIALESLYPSAMPSTTQIPHDAVIVLTTLAAEADAAAFARTLVEERLAACVNVLPAMTSVYRWKGEIEQDREQQLVIKTSREKTEELQARLRQLHPYELPEFLILAAGGSQAYLGWIRENTA